MTTERANIQKTDAEKNDIQAEIDEATEHITELQEDLKALNEALDTATKDLDTVKKETSKSSKVLDQALKDIASKVCEGIYHSIDNTEIYLVFKNDEIEKLASERSSIYRKCRLEEVKLPMLAGSLRDVPMEEVTKCWIFVIQQCSPWCLEPSRGGHDGSR